MDLLADWWLATQWPTGLRQIVEIQAEAAADYRAPSSAGREQTFGLSPLQEGRLYAKMKAGALLATGSM
jgi:hypothetical protein